MDIKSILKQLGVRTYSATAGRAEKAGHSKTHVDVGGVKYAVEIKVTDSGLQLVLSPEVPVLFAKQREDLINEIMKKLGITKAAATTRFDRFVGPALPQQLPAGKAAKKTKAKQTKAKQTKATSSLTLKKVLADGKKEGLFLHGIYEYIVDRPGHTWLFPEPRKHNGKYTGAWTAGQVYRKGQKFGVGSAGGKTSEAFMAKVNPMILSKVSQEALARWAHRRLHRLKTYKASDLDAWAAQHSGVSREKVTKYLNSLPISKSWEIAKDPTGAARIGRAVKGLLGKGEMVIPRQTPQQAAAVQQDDPKQTKPKQTKPKQTKPKQTKPKQTKPAKKPVTKKPTAAEKKAQQQAARVMKEQQRAAKEQQRAATAKKKAQQQAAARKKQQAAATRKKQQQAAARKKQQQSVAVLTQVSDDYQQPPTKIYEQDIDISGASFI